MPNLDLTFRNAVPDDALLLMRLFQKTKGRISQDALFLDFQKLQGALAAENSFALLSLRGDNVVAAVIVLFDPLQRLAKFSRLMVDTELADAQEVMRKSLRHALNYLKEVIKDVDAVYTTTLSTPLTIQEITLLEGFKILGVFPNALGADNTQLNGLTALYFNDVEHVKRQGHFSLHPAIKPFFQICQKQLGLPDLPVATTDQLHPVIDYESMPPLEIISAPLLVRSKFLKMKEKHSQIINFYPFYNPNTLICDPDQSVEIYVRIDANKRFAAIISEHLQRSVEPVALYQAVLQLLRQQNISYVEIINDAADAYGIQCILDAAFTPCAYIPAFKVQNDLRRDYVVFGKSFEYMCRPDLHVEKTYIDFFKQYLKIERRNYFRKV